MSETILSIRPRQRRLAALGPGERVINGRVYYSAAWLSTAARFEAEAVTAAPEPTRASFSSPATVWLCPGERAIGCRVFYSATGSTDRIQIQAAIRRGGRSREEVTG